MLTQWVEREASRSGGRAPDISVVMGVYNGADLLQETMDSVRAQSDADFEFIIVNDGSTDPGVRAMLADLVAQEPRARVLHKAHEGLTRALMAGCGGARGAYVARIDAGDVMLPGRLASQRACLEADPDIVFVSCWTEYCGPEWESLYRLESVTDAKGVDMCPRARDTYPHVGPLHHGSVMFRRGVYEGVGGYRPEFYYGQDWDLWYRLAERGRFAIVPECLYRVRLFPTGISGMNRLRQERIGRQALAAHWCRRAGEPEEDVLAKAALIRPGETGRGARASRGEGAHHIAELLRKRRDRRCQRYFRQALRENPLRLNSLVRWGQSMLSMGWAG
jgi:glycosyltransferase involved in cell wall biosynthesis